MDPSCANGIAYKFRQPDLEAGTSFALEALPRMPEWGLRGVLLSKINKSKHGIEPKACLWSLNV
jgi:hypothetical protein